MQSQTCSAGAECVMGLETGMTGCSDEVNCLDVGCTGFPVCGHGTEVCDPCGCCDVRGGGMVDACGNSIDVDGHSRFVFDDTNLCFEVEPCEDGELCGYDEYDRATCWPYP